MKTENYTTPKLCGDDLSKDWFVFFYYTDQLSGKKKLFRYKMGINRLKTKKERNARASAIISALSIKLESGWSPITKKIENSQNKTVSEALDEIFEIKSAYLTKESIRTYGNQIDLFKRWLVQEGLDHLYTQNFNSDHMRKYCDWMLGVKKYSGKTYNGHIATLRTFFSEMVDRKYMEVTPMEGFKFVRQDTGKNVTFSNEDERKFETVKRIDPNFYLATRFVRYCFLRRTELSKLQVKHLNWVNKTITIPSESAKSRVQDSVTIPKTLERMIERSGVLNLDPDTYLFGKHFVPSAEILKRLDDFSDMQRRINDKLDISEDSTFYAWKHTGVVELYNLTKDPYVVMRQCRHTDIKMTMIYLRSLGCGVNEQVREW